MRFNNNAQVRDHAAQLAAALAINTIAIAATPSRTPVDVCKTCVTTGKMRLPLEPEPPFPPALLGQSKPSPLSAHCVICRSAVVELDE